MPKVRNGSTAVVHHPISSTSAFGGEAEVKNAGNHDFEGPESANTGRSGNRQQASIRRYKRAAKGSPKVYVGFYPPIVEVLVMTTT
jgi:hypothetical protein